MNFTRISIVCLIVSLLYACKNPNKDLENPHNLHEYKFLSLKTEPLEAPKNVSESPNFILDYHRLPSLLKLSTLEGKYFFITEYNHNLKIGNAPKLNYSIKGQNVLPNDNKTLKMFSLFLLFDSAINYMEKELNLKIQDMLNA